HLYAGSEAQVDFAGQSIALRQETDYPYAGLVNLTLGLQQPATFDLRLRIPGWCRAFTLAVNGEAVEADVVLGYAAVERTWQPGDRVTLDLAMPVERVAAHPAIAADAGRTAIQRGPLVYCLEAVDHAGADVRAFSLPDAAVLTPREADLFSGTVMIEAEGLRPVPDGDGLYTPLDGAKTQPVALRLIPYALWANRAPGAMAVWLPRA
ncbi:MAG: glycoside hydrolase family 127 protein, partial [Anaerolineae bacterium]|nr:glycoside hydrolase family 127 protein [Anaerolineae bacterium]